MTDTVTEKPPLEQVVEPVADTEAAIETGSAQPHADDGNEQVQPVENPVFADRARIAARFKAQREQRQEEIADAAHEQIAADAGAAADQPPDAPRTIKVKVRHEVRELPEQDVIAAAQK